MAEKIQTHKSLKRTKSAEPTSSRKRSPRLHLSGHLSLRLTYLEAYIPVAVVEFLKSQVNNSFSVSNLPLVQHEEETVVMFIDVSSFTTTTETMTSYGPGGLEKLVEQLNRLFSMMLKRIRKQGGDVLKFAGDAIEVYWPVNPYTDSLPATAARAVAVALKIQDLITKKFSEMNFEPYGQEKQDFGSEEYAGTDPDISTCPELPHELRVKLGIGFGKMTMLHLGGSQDTLHRNCVEFIPIGKGIVDAHSCERSAEKGQVIISEEVYKKIKGFGFATEVVAGNAEDPFFVVTGLQGVTKGKNVKSPRGTVVPVGDEEPRRLMAGSERRSTSREKTLTLLKNRVVLEEFLDGYLPSTVIPYIKEQNEFWLPEFRRVTTIFFKINLDNKVFEAISKGEQKETHQLQDIFKVIQSTVFRYEGSINKMFFDKGSWNVLVVFGLSPFAHDDDPLRGILCALAVVGLLENHLATINENTNVASRCCAGITTGLAFCGVLGSTKAARENSLSNAKTSKGSKLLSGLGIDQLQMIKREQKEYSVLGDCINVASRLMDLAFFKEEALFFDETTAISTGEAIENIPFSEEAISVKGKSKLVKVFQIPEKIYEGDSSVYQHAKKKKMKRMSVVRTPLDKSQHHSLIPKIPMLGRLAKTMNKKNLRTKKGTTTRVQNRKRTSFFSPRRRRASQADTSHATEIDVKANSPAAPERNKRRRSVFMTLRAKKSLPVEKYTKTEESLRITTVKKPVRRGTLIFNSNMLKKKTLVDEPVDTEGLQFVFNRLEAVRKDFVASCGPISDTVAHRSKKEKKKTPTGKGRTELEEIGVRNRKTGEFGKIRAVCVEGSIGAGKSHAIAQAFYSTKSKQNSRVFLVTASPFESREKFKGFNVWREFFIMVFEKVQKVTEKKAKLTIEALIENALDLSKHTFKNSDTVRGSYAPKKLHKPDTNFLYLLNDVFGSKFTNEENKTPDKKNKTPVKKNKTPDKNNNPEEKNIRINSSIVYSEDDIISRLISRDPLSTPNITKLKDNDRAIQETVNLVSGVITGLSLMTDNNSKRMMIAIIDDAQLLPTNSWLVCMELVEWWGKSNLLIVLGLRNVSFFDPNEKQKQRQSTGSQFRSSHMQNSLEAFELPKLKTIDAQKNYLRQKNGTALLFRNRLKTMQATEFVHLKNMNKFIWVIISHAFQINPDRAPPSELLDFFIEKTNGNPLYIVDAMKQYLSMKLLILRQVPLNSEKESSEKITVLEVTESFKQMLVNNKLPMPISVESVCGMFLDSLTTMQQVALKVAAMNEGVCFNRKLVREALPIEDPERNFNNEWEGLVAADVIQLQVSNIPSKVLKDESTDMNKSSEITKQVTDPDLILYRFQAEWVKDSLVNRMLFKQRIFLREQLSQPRKTSY